MRVASSGFAVLVSMAALGCGEGERDSGIYGSSAASVEGDEPGDEVDESGSGESSDASTSADDASTSTSTSDDTSSGDTTTTTTTDDGNGACGNGVIDGGEQCDGADLAGSSCTALGYEGGRLACDPTICVFDTSGCTNGNGNECDAFCGGCTCPSDECIMCCAQLGKVDACNGGMCSCF
ncbi:hypothetical protein ACNOYE_34300 [Nannocystaceae bacterium ST9]